MLSGYYLKAEEVWVFALGLPSDPLVCRGMGQAEISRPMRPWETLANGNNRTKYNLYHCDGYEEDSINANRFRQCDGVSIFPMNGADHNVMTPIVESGLLEDMLPPYSLAQQDT